MGFITIPEELLNLGLTLPELIVTGLINGYSQNDQGVFYGTRQYIQKWICCKSHHTVDKTLKSLCEKGIIEKGTIVADGQLRCTYRINPEFAIAEGGQKLPYGADNAVEGGKNCPLEGAKIAHNNKVYNKTDIKDSKENIQKKEPVIPAEIAMFESAEFRNTWFDLMQQPKWRKKTPHAIKLAAKFLASHTESVAIAIMNNTIMNGWQGLFELDKRQSATMTASTATISALRASEEQFNKIVERRKKQAIEP